MNCHRHLVVEGNFSEFWRRVVGVIAVVAVVTVTAATAHADDSVEDEWYGWHIMPVDAASIGLIAYGVADGESTAVFSGFAGYALGGPIVHLAHERWWESAGSLGLRLGLPLTGVLIANLLDSSGGNTFSAGGFANAMLWLTAGTVSAMALDYIFLAQKPTSESGDSASEVQMLQLQWQF